jgi:hypothetical protein
MRRVLACALAAVAIVVVGAPRARACHPCVDGEPCLPHGGCGGDTDFRRGIVLIVATVEDEAPTRWGLRVQATRVQPLSIAGVFVRGRTVCHGPRCTGRRGPLGGRVLATSPFTFAVEARFRNGSRCEFTRSSADGQTEMAYRCYDRDGILAGEGPVEIVDARTIH